ncbi:MAG: hypothetical protein WBC44_06645 [Planctomycetaceae bacterium]
MTSSIDEILIDSIVAGVLDRLRGASAPHTPASGGRQPSEATSSVPLDSRKADALRSPLLLSDRVVTGALLEASLGGSKAVRFAPKAVLTPSARDYLRMHGIEWAYSRPTAAGRKSTERPGAVLVVRSTPALERVLGSTLPGVRKELLSCPDDAARLAVAEISRGGFLHAAIFAEQTHRTACLANRHAAVKAVAVRDASEIPAVRKQLRANVWCLDPTGRGDFELMNLVKAIVREHSH